MSDASDESSLPSTPLALHDASGNSDHIKPDWQTRLPYAHAYVEQTMFTGCTDDLQMVGSWDVLDVDYEMGDTTLSKDGVDIHVNGSGGYLCHCAMPLCTNNIVHVCRHGSPIGLRRTGHAGTSILLGDGISTAKR